MKTYPIIGKNGKVEEFKPKPPQDKPQAGAGENQAPQDNTQTGAGDTPPKQ